MKDSRIKLRSAGLGYLINRIQTLFVSMLRIWTIPIVLMLSVSSGFTTYYGLSHFITPWIALIITIAIQSIIVICSLEMAGIHWTANRVRYFSVVSSLCIAVTASITFSYFKFYEISEQESLHIDRVQQIRQDIKSYLGSVLAQKSQLLQNHQQALDKASADVSQAYFGTHEQIAPGYKNQIGEGPFWRHYNQIYQEKKQAFQVQEQAFLDLDAKIRQLQTSLGDLDVAQNQETAYYQMLKNYQDIQLIVNQLSSSAGLQLPDAPMLMTYKQFVEEVKPSFAMWQGFSWFAFACAAMVDFFTVLLSYRLEFTAPGPLTVQEEELVFECLRQFSEFRINQNDELEMVIEKSELEKARRYSDWSRMFVVGLLLSRGFLRKVDARTVEFAPSLYPLIAEKMSDKIAALKAKSLPKAPADEP
ncbi:hypothetical protein [Methylomonas rivi]|uniref:DUF4407 domain-containing protein n=1 Tax=Methylomonas rivi TaxID=2952226 RepID=A0ABT1TZS2_9GAMM|nr:hypothetical protein [Methylomonas sp. WSC-6]MBS4051704.1 hypothetical protein [Methylomonas sp.]MCQ8127049.1 hypothetical protein [Methylomonas sp. WSC-6]